MYAPGQMRTALSLGCGVLWGNRNVLYQEQPFKQDRQREVQMTQFEQGCLDPERQQNGLCSPTDLVGESPPVQGRTVRRRRCWLRARVSVHSSTVCLGHVSLTVPRCRGQGRGTPRVVGPNGQGGWRSVLQGWLGPVPSPVTSSLEIWANYWDFFLTDL